MTGSRSADTSSTLLARLQHDVPDQRAWAEFVRRYGKQIERWCRCWKLQPADAEDVAQTMMVRLARKMREFRYDRSKSFRAYLKTLAHYAWCDFLEQRKRQPGKGAGDSAVLAALQTVEVQDDLVRRFDAEYDLELLRLAAVRVRRRVEPQTWEAFRLTTDDGLSGAEAAQRLQLKVATVFKARSKVRKMLKEEIGKLDPASETGT